jgi:ferredoxin
MKATLSVRKGNSIAEFTVRPGIGLQAVALRNPGWFEFDCRRADCGVCLVRVVAGAEGLSAPTTEESEFLQAMRAGAEERLACQVRIQGDCSLEIPDEGIV